jgi:hypothetical protein
MGAQPRPFLPFFFFVRGRDTGWDCIPRKKSPGGLVLREQRQPALGTRGGIPATAAEPAADDGDTPAIA